MNMDSAVFSRKIRTAAELASFLTWTWASSSSSCVRSMLIRGLTPPAWDYSAQVLHLVDGRSRAVFGNETEEAESGEVEEVQMEG